MLSPNGRTREIIVIMLVLCAWAFPPQPAAWAVYPDGGKHLPPVTETTLLSEYGGPRPSLLRNLPESYRDFIAYLKGQGVWDDPQALARVIESLGGPTMERYELNINPNSRSNISNFALIVGTWERVWELRPLTVKEELWLGTAYASLLVFSENPATRLVTGFGGEATGDGGAEHPVLKWLETASGVIQQAYFWTANHLLNRPELDRQTAVTVMRGLGNMPGVDPELALQAQRLIAAWERTPAARNKLITKALEQGYHSLAEETWNSLTPQDTADESFAEAAETRRKAMELESLTGQKSYQARLRRAWIWLEFDRVGEAERMFRRLINEDDQQIEAWTGLAKATFHRDFQAVVEIIEEASRRVSTRNAEFLELKIGLGGLSIMASFSGGVLEKEGVDPTRRTLKTLLAENEEYRRFKPLMAEISFAWLEFVGSFLRDEGEGSCPALYERAYTRVEKVLSQKPDHPQALALEVPLRIMAFGLRQSLDVLTRKLPDSITGEKRKKLRLDRVQCLLGGAWSLRDEKWLDWAAEELDQLEAENPEDGESTAVQQGRGLLWALRAMGRKAQRDEANARALAHYQRALAKALEKDRALLLNNVLFLQISLGRIKEALETRTQIERLGGDGQTLTLLLPNKVWWAEHHQKDSITADLVVSEIKDDPESRASAAVMVLAGQLAGAQGDPNKKAELWSRALKGREFCGALPLCQSCYHPGPVFAAYSFGWAQSYSTEYGLINEISLKQHHWLLHSRGQGQGPGGWPSVEEIKAVLNSGAKAKRPN